SARAGAVRFVITATGARLDELTAADLVTCPVDGTGWDGERRPSVEVEMHRAVYAAVPEAGAVLHASAPYTTLVACSRMRLPVAMNTDGILYVGPVRRVPYPPPASADLAPAAAPA